MEKLGCLVEFKNVTFKYQMQSSCSIRPFFYAKPGETTAKWRNRKWEVYCGEFTTRFFDVTSVSPYRWY
jgi:hypothetical protein